MAGLAQVQSLVGLTPEPALIFPPKPSKGNEAYTGEGNVCSGKKIKQKIQELLQKPPQTLKTQASSPENKGIISALLKFVRGRKREEKALAEEKEMREIKVVRGRKREEKPLAEEKDMRQGLNGEWLTERDFIFDSSPKVSLSPDFDGTENKEVKVYGRWGKSWHSKKVKLPATFAESGMDPENEGIISDMLRFVRDEEIYRKEGRPWKRGYLLFDSPGTIDRSSLIAAMANRVEFDIYDLNLTGLTSISELTNVLASIRSRSLIGIKDFDHWAGKLPYLKNELTVSGLLKIIHGLLSNCGSEQIILVSANHNHIDRVDVALLRPLYTDLYIHTSSPQPKALPDGGEIVLLDSSEQKPSVYFDATNNGAYQSDVLVSNSEKKSTREASRRQRMPEGVLSLVDSTTKISFTDFDAPDNSAHLVRAYLPQSGPIVFNSVKEDNVEGLNRECLTKSVISLDDSCKQKSLSDVAVAENKSHLVRAYQSGPVVSLSANKNTGEALKRECVTKSILCLEDLQQHSGGRHDVAAKSICTFYDPGSHTTDSLALISPKVLGTLLIWEQPNDCVPLLSMGRLTLEGCVRREKSPDLPGVMQIIGLPLQSAIGLTDGGHILAYLFQGRKL